MQEERAGVRCGLDAEDALDRMKLGAQLTRSTRVADFVMVPNGYDGSTGASTLQYSITTPALGHGYEALDVFLRWL